LKYGCNPHQTYADASPIDSATVPIELLNGNPSMINYLDATNAWQLVRELKNALGLPAAASFKHCSPAGAAVAVDLTDDLERAYEVVGKKLTPLACAYVRARGADPKSSFGDFVALSDVVDVETANFLKGVVSDGVIAPGYDPEALSILSSKKGGGFIVMRGDADFTPPARESRQVFGMQLTQDRNNREVTLDDVATPECGEFTDAARRDMVLGLIALKYTQSNSVGYALDGQMIGIGAGQQSRVDCTKLAGQKADTWHLGRHPRVLDLVFKAGVKRQARINWRIRFLEGDLTQFEEVALREVLDGSHDPLTDADKSEWIQKLDGVSMVSDGFIPFRDNIDHASKHGVKFIAQPGGSARDDDIRSACKDYGISMAHTGLRLFHH
ncbi:MAG: phosphoribosylaminoimidazolecarboxamide formyltransferase, partial [Myxococcota bacterium]|nr:phosphoribosylaminoimidazolecarboxamide formyltransferase [Myxococcota bacterium]